MTKRKTPASYTKRYNEIHGTNYDIVLRLVEEDLSEFWLTLNGVDSEYVKVFFVKRLPGEASKYTYYAGRIYKIIYSGLEKRESKWRIHSFTANRQRCHTWTCTGPELNEDSMTTTTDDGFGLVLGPMRIIDV